MKKLEGKIVLVTGGGSGIGKGIALKLAENGAKVIICGRRENVLEETSKLNENISYIKADITKDEDIKNIVSMINEKFEGKLDILVNNAGWCPVMPLKEIKIEDYDNAFTLDVRALVNVTINTLPMILKAKGNIINMSSVGATHRAVNLSMYQAAKAAVENLRKCWAIELAPDVVRVNAIAPGAISTDIWKVPGLTPEQSKAHIDSITSTIPCKRIGEPEDIANAVLYLVSTDASYITGTVIAVDGGMGAI